MLRIVVPVSVVVIGAILLWVYSYSSDVTDSDCMVVGKHRSPILWNPDVSTSASPGMLESEMSYTFVEFGGTWSLNNESGRWIKIIVESNRVHDDTVSYGWVLDKNITLQGDCLSIN